MKEATLREMINFLTPLNRAFCSDDYDKSLDYLCRFLAFKTYSFNNDDQYNGWIIPPKWKVTKADLIFEGERIYNGLNHPIAVPSLVKPFTGTVDLAELKDHLYFTPKYDDALPFHFRYLYRPWDRDWGFCVPQILYKSLTEGDYTVEIHTEESDGELKVLEYFHQGEHDETIAFIAHLDHPGLANDDVSGVALGVHLLEEISKRKTKFSYVLIIVQEFIGSEYYLGKSKSPVIPNIIEGVFLESLGSETAFSLQRSLSNSSNLDFYLSKCLSSQVEKFQEKDFGKVVGNDEKIFESYGISTSSISRHPFPEYHTSKDSAENISDISMEKSFKLLIDLFGRLENDSFFKKTFIGTPSLSNPKIDLYIEPGQPALGISSKDNYTEWKQLVDSLLYLPQNKVLSIMKFIENTNIEEDELVAYLKKWEINKLIEVL